MKDNKELMLVKKIIKLLKNGVEEENGIRQFDIIDYYHMTKKFPKNLYESTINNVKDIISEEDRKIFYSFVCKNLNDKKLKIKDIMEIKHIVLIDDIPTEISDFEKMDTINYLKKNKLPITSETYNIVLKKHLEGSINFEEKEEDKLLVR